MWIYTSEFFVSLADTDQDRYPQDGNEYVTARFRRRIHAERFTHRAIRYSLGTPLSRWTVGPVLHTPDRDYPYRVIVDRRLVANLLAHYALDEVKYARFKDSVVDEDVHYPYLLVYDATENLNDDLARTP